jgi:hypothetical protein
MYGLGIIHDVSSTQARSSGRASTSFVCLVELSKNEFDALQEANTALSRHRQQMSFLNLVLWNFEDYVQCQEQLLLAGIGHSALSLRNPELDLNRRLMNLLSAVRTYLDHTETDLKRRFGENSERYTRFEDLTHKLYDSCFSYRFLYEFRNFVQHCGLPLDSFDHTRTYNSRVLSATVSRSRLLQDFKWKSALRDEIESLPEEIDIASFLLEHVDQLTTLHERLCAEELSALREAAALVLSRYSEVAQYPGVPCVFTMPDAPTPDSGLSSTSTLTFEHFALEIAVAEFVGENPRTPTVGPGHTKPALPWRTPAAP